MIKWGLNDMGGIIRSGAISILALILLLSFTAVSVSAGTTINVPGDKTSIQAAIAAASSGDTIIVGSSYNINENVDVNKGDLTIMASGEDVVVEASNTNDHVIYVTADYTNISGFRIEGATSNGKSGIFLDGVNHCNISENEITDNYYGIDIYQSSDNIVLENNISSNDRGIKMYHSDNNTISENKVTYNDLDGIHMSWCDLNDLLENTVSNNDGSGIKMTSYSSDNNLTSNTVNSNSGNGIFLDYGSEVTNLTGNSVNSNDGYGIRLSQSENSVLSGNSMSGNGYNFGVDGYSESHYVHDIDDSNTVASMPIYYVVSRTGYTVPSGAGYVGVIDSEDITVSDQTLTKNGQGLIIAFSSELLVEDVTATDNNIGIYLLESDYNDIVDSDISSNDNYGIFIEYSSFNNITGCDIKENDGEGIFIRGLEQGGGEGEGDSDEGHSYHNITGNVVSDNRYNGVHLEYEEYCNISNNVVDSNGGTGIRIDYSSYNKVTGNTVNGSGEDGIFVGALESMSYNDVLDNIVTKNGLEYGSAGICLEGEENCKVSGNTVKFNFYGIVLKEGSYKNEVSGNIISENTYGGIFFSGNVWDTEVKNNLVTKNGEYGFYIGWGFGNTNIIALNNIAENGVLNTLSGGYEYNFYNDHTEDIDATENWWATTDNDTIDASIYDKYDNAYSGEVIYKPKLTSASPGAPVPEVATVILLAIGLLVIVGYVRIKTR
ncbi:MAG: NosD domain-containing protein [Halobacteriota archaeon]|nr:NosD domain-containing protein [Halobacteriota archaeon]